MQHSTYSLTILNAARGALEAHPEGFKLSTFELDDYDGGLMNQGRAILHFTLKRGLCAPMNLSWSQDVHGAWSFSATLLDTTITLRQLELEETVTTVVRDLLLSVVPRA